MCKDNYTLVGTSCIPASKGKLILASWLMHAQAGRLFDSHQLPSGFAPLALRGCLSSHWSLQAAAVPSMHPAPRACSIMPYGLPLVRLFLRQVHGLQGRLDAERHSLHQRQGRPDTMPC